MRIDPWLVILCLIAAGPVVAWYIGYRWDRDHPTDILKPHEDD